MRPTQPTPLPTLRDPLLGQNVGGYIVEEMLGEGGMGLVYRARHPLLNRHFAIKVLRPEIAADSASSGNFVREAQTLSTLKHPSITDIVGFGPLDDGRHYMVMEFLEGRTVEAELQSGRIFPERALKIADEILDALSAAHSVDVIHRDLKPSNVFLARVSGGRELAKLLDFGLAKHQPVSIVGVNVVSAAGKSVVAGTPEYIAPEQAQGDTAGKQSDLYSFGVMLFEMLTGVLPFTSDEEFAGEERIRRLLVKHITHPAPTIDASAAGVQFPEGLAEIVSDLLKKKPADRPLSADIVRRRLQRVYRTLQQDSTLQRPNPLLASTPEASNGAVNIPPAQPAPKDVPTARVIRVGDTERAIAAGVGNRKGVRTTSIVLAVIALAVFWWWQRGSPPVEVVEVMPAVAAPVVEVMPAAADPLVDAKPPVVEPAAPEPTPVEVPPEDDLAALSPAPKPVIRPTRAPVLVEAARPWAAMAKGCQPTDVWRDDAKRSLRELGTLAASDPKKWKEYNLREAAVSKSVTTASDPAECGQASHQIANLAQLILKP